MTMPRLESAPERHAVPPVPTSLPFRRPSSGYLSVGVSSFSATKLEKNRVSHGTKTRRRKRGKLTRCKSGEVHDARKNLNMNIPIHPRVLEDQGDDLGTFHTISRASNWRGFSTYKVAGSTMPSQ
jgi:hypothetical protein